jgi:hypothetical protein
MPRNNNNINVSLPHIITNTSFYVRNLRYNICRQVSHSYISLCYNDGLIECLEDIEENNKNKYMLCIGYKDKDFQIALTGSCRKKEDIIDAVKRETFEEVDIESEQFKLFTKCQCKKNNKMIDSYIYKVAAHHCQQSKKERCDENNSKDDDRTKKITVVIYGSLEEISKIICRSRLDENNTENIGFYVAIKISEAITICRQITELRKLYHWKTVFSFCYRKISLRSTI